MSGPQRAKIAPYISVAVADSARAAVEALRGVEPHCASLSTLVEVALRREVERLERKRNGGVAFPVVAGLRSGPGGVREPAGGG